MHPLDWHIAQRPRVGTPRSRHRRALLQSNPVPIGEPGRNILAINDDSRVHAGWRPRRGGRREAFRL